MVTIRTINDLILNALDFYKTAQPELDTKPGTVSRDLLIDGPSAQLALVYQELARVKAAQSLRLSLGNDLDKLGSNYGATRKQGSASSGTAICTFTGIDADISINKGDVVTASNGSTFTVQNGITVSVNNINTYRATASKYRPQLDYANISDEYAVEISVKATAPGTLGNISRYSITTISTSGVSNVTNVSPFGGGSDSESDAAFRSRILAIFSGANTGTALGYRNAVMADDSVIDAIVVQPGDPLMTRDGTQVIIAQDGSMTIASEGTGGKVDVYVYGFRLVEIIDSYIYRDQSNKDDPTDPANDHVLGQIAADVNKTVPQKRIDDLETGVLPDQPVNNILEVSGSSSGANFLLKQTDSLGRITGNYELLRDTGAYAGSPWGFDKLHWINSQIIDLSEDQTKGRFNGQDSLSFVDVTKIGAATQNVSIINENGQVSASDRSSIQLSHKPITNVTRVFNLTTGERYVVASQNPDGTGNTNTTGRITIRGSTLPAISDILQVDYTWIFNYDPSFDFDNKLTNSNPRSATDSIDWGFSNAVRREEAIVQSIGLGAQLTVQVTHSISSVISVNKMAAPYIGAVTQISGRLAIIVPILVTSVVSITRLTDGAELYATSADDGSYTSFTIFFPSDSVAEYGDSVQVIYNAVDVFTISGVSGSFDSNTITLSASASVVPGDIVECNYIANIKTLVPATQLSALPISRDGNGFVTSTAPTTVIGTQPMTFVFSSPGVVEKSLRMAPSRLQLTIAGSISVGTLTITGTTFGRIAEVILPVANSSLTHDLSSPIKTYLGLQSTQSVPSTVEVVRLISAELVSVASGDEVLNVDHTYDIIGYKLRNNTYVKAESIQDSSLSQTQVTLPRTTDNLANLPAIGDHLRLTFYISTTSDVENVSFSKSGILYTNKIFALVNTIVVSSGFTSGQSQSATLTVSNQNQPPSGNRYTATYDYVAPKANERITIRYNCNQIIKDSTTSIEAVRPISADVLAKAAVAIYIDVEMAIVVTTGYQNTSTIVAQNVKDAVTSALNASSLNTVIDSSDLINAAYSVAGVDRVRIISFNKEDEAGSVLSIQAQKNEYLQANNVTVTVETR